MAVRLRILKPIDSNMGQWMSEFNRAGLKNVTDVTK